MDLPREDMRLYSTNFTIKFNILECGSNHFGPRFTCTSCAAELFGVYCSPRRLYLEGFSSRWISCPGLPCTREIFRALSYKGGYRRRCTCPAPLLHRPPPHTSLFSIFLLLTPVLFSFPWRYIIAIEVSPASGSHRHRHTSLQVPLLVTC